MPIRITPKTKKIKVSKPKQSDMASKTTENMPTKPLPSETKRYQLAQVYLSVDTTEGRRTVRAAIDTQSNVSYANWNISHTRKWKEGEVRTVRGIGGLIEGGMPRMVKVVKHGKQINIPARTPPMGVFEDGVDMLLSAAHCRTLGIDVNHAISNLQHKPVKWLPRKLNRHISQMRNKHNTCMHDNTNWANKRTLRLLLIRHGVHDTRGLSKKQLQAKLADVTDTQQCEYLRCLLSEKRVAAYMQKVGGRIKEGK